jgi:hypothetical protein
LAVKLQAEGTSAVAARKAASYSNIRNATYAGHSKGWTFDKYVIEHQTAHNELLSLGEPVPETKKVDDFLAGITGDVLSTSKVFIAGDHDKLHNFEKCQQYLKTVAMVKTPARSSRSVKKLYQDKRGKGKGKGKERSKSKANSKDKLADDKPPADVTIHGGQWGSKDYRALNKEQKLEVDRLRIKAKGEGKVAGKIVVKKLVTIAKEVEPPKPTSSPEEARAPSSEESSENSNDSDSSFPQPPSPKRVVSDAEKKRKRMMAKDTYTSNKETVVESNAKSSADYKKAVKAHAKKPVDSVKPKLNAGDAFGKQAHAAAKETKESKPKKAKKGD